MSPRRAPSGEKITATVCTFVVLGVLAGLLTAQPAGPAKSDDLGRLESDLRFQLDLTYRLDRGQFEERSGEVDGAAVAWKTSRQTAEDAHDYAAWLREALDRSLPGRHEELPPAPTFSALEAVMPAPRSAAADLRVAAKQVMPPVAPPSVAPLPTLQPNPTSKIQNPKSPERSATADLRVAAKPSVAPTPKAPVASAPQPPVARTPEPRVAAKPVLVAAATAPPANVGVNVAELNARIAGYHQGLDEIQAAAVAPRDALSVERIADLAHQLDGLATEREFVAMYYGVLSPAERRSVTPPRKLDKVARLLRSELATAAATGNDDDFLKPFEVDQAEVDRLDARLEALGSGR